MCPEKMSAEINLYFECGICFHRYDPVHRKPKYLKCHHYFCLGCVQSLANNSTIKCPMCSHVTQLEFKDLDKCLATNHDILIFLKQLNIRDTIIQEKKSETSWCFECRQVATPTCHSNQHELVHVPNLDEPAVKDQARLLSSCQNSLETACRERMNLQSSLLSLESSLHSLSRSLALLVENNATKLQDLRRQVADIDQMMRDGSFQSTDVGKLPEKCQLEASAALDLMRVVSGKKPKHMSLSFDKENQHDSKASLISSDFIPPSTVQQLLQFLLAVYPFKIETADSVESEALDPRKTSNEEAKPPVPLKPDAVRLLRKSNPQTSQESPHTLMRIDPTPSQDVSRISSSSDSSGMSEQQNSSSSRTSLNEESISEKVQELLLKRSYTSIWHPMAQIVISNHVNGDILHVEMANLDGKVHPTRKRLAQHKDPACALDWHVDGTRFASGTRNGCVCVWTCEGQKLQTLNPHGGHVTVVKWNYSGTYLASGGLDKKIAIWNSTTGAHQCSFYHPTGPVLQIEWQSPDTFAYSSSEGNIYFHNIKERNPILTFSEHKALVTSISWDGLFLASSSVDKTVKLWSKCSNKSIQSHQHHSDIVNQIKWGPPYGNNSSARFLASCSDDGTAILFDVNFSKIAHTVTCQDKQPIKSISFSPDGSILATGSQEGVVQLWSTKEGRCLETLPKSRNSISHLSFSADGNLLAISAANMGGWIVDVRAIKK